MAEGNVIDVTSKKLGKTGPKPTKYIDEFVQSVPLYKRIAERSYGASLSISHVTIHKLKKKGRLKTHTSTNHPALISNHKVARLKWVLSHLLYVEQNNKPKFEDLQQYLHIDEKWQGNVLHDREYGIFPLVYETTAKKKSKNKEAGTVEIKATQNVNKDAIREMILNNVIPLEGFNVLFIYQPSQTPDLNVLDLELFNALQFIQYQSFPKNFGELIDNVKKAYDSFYLVLNKYSWITLQCCMEEIVKHLVGNNFTPPHKGDKRLEKTRLATRTTRFGEGFSSISC
ncbi:uncharacterized protein LOC110740270 [Chenopodium quinoa]|uniref:uncharacterized protein LOC110740270 n=1 Tax=Chenopodium quinoa TaxID=63459 RepID=UPI000B797FA1|nr:uncharacterized protein LOC110740270 [Chenopodium quinoa]